MLNPTNIARKKPGKLIVHAAQMIYAIQMELPENFQMDCSCTEVIISSLIIRSDRMELARKVNETNTIQKASCMKNKFGFLDNSNINTYHLNSRGLHLNRVGSALLQANILHYFSSND